jgi:hypothetical protein
VVDLHREFLEFLHQIRSEENPDMEIVITVIDNIHAKETGENTASDTRALMEMESSLPFVLQIEDPQELWHLGPERYRNLSRTYQAMVRDDDLILDINIVPYREWDISLAPTRQPTGMELAQLMRAARQKENRVALYSESSIYEVDLPWVAYTLGSNSRETIGPKQWMVESDHKTILALDSRLHKNIRVNGLLWPAYYKGKTILPGGEQIIEPLRPIEFVNTVFQSTARIVDISGELESCKLISQGLELAYSSTMPNHLIVNENPREIFIDGIKTALPSDRGLPGYTVRLPAGDHEVKIITNSKMGVFIKNFSIIASALIVFLSTFGGTILIILYFIRAGRRRRRKKHQTALEKN